MNNDNNGDDDSSSGSSMILDLLRCQNDPVSNVLEIPEEKSGVDNSLAQFKSVSDETTFISEIPTASYIEEAIVVTPAERKQSVELLRDQLCEELAHPHLFPSGKFGYKDERKKPISPSRYFN